MCAGRLPRELPVDAGDWALLLALAKRHRVEPVVASALATAGDDAVPEAVAGWRDEVVAENERKAKVAALEFQQISKFARDAGEKDVRIIKGNCLSSWLYGSTSARHVGDLDILVRAEGVAAVDGVLRRMGYSCSVPRDVVETSLLLAAHHVLEYEGTGARPSVELHWRWMRNPHVLPFDAARVWGRDGSCDAVRTEMIVYLFVHGGHHAWSRLKWLVDVHRLCGPGVDPAPDWERVQRRATELGVRRALDLGLALSRDLLGTSLPVEVDGRRVAGLVAACRAQLFAAVPSAANPSGVAAIRRQISLIDDAPQALRALARHVLTPPVADIGAVPRVARSGPVLVALRPLFWAARVLRS